MQSQKRVLTLFVFLLSLLSLSRVFAQAQSLGDVFPGYLIYEKRESGRTQTLIRSVNGATRFQIQDMDLLADHRCPYTASLATQWTAHLSALAAVQNPTKLIVYDFIAQQPVLELDWEDDWKKCTFSWLNDTILRIQHLQEYGIVTDIDIRSGNVTAHETSSSYSAFDDYGAVVYNLNGNLAFTVRCKGQVIWNWLGWGQLNCMGGEDAVVFDPIDDSIVANLEDAEASVFVSPGGPVEVGEDFYWSPSGRYLLYPGLSGAKVYDSLTHLSVAADSRMSMPAASLPNPAWSPDERYIAYWEQDRNLPNEFRLQLYQLKTQTSRPIAQAYSVANCDYQQGKLAWSPDSRFVAFIDASCALVSVNIIDDTVTLLDKDVRHLIAWTR